MSALTPADITPGVVVTNGKGRFRMVTEVHHYDTYARAHYAATYTNAKGLMKPAALWTLDVMCDVSHLLLWSTRLATPTERADVIRCLNPKGIE
jgi:hypothetical protein